MTAPTRTIQRRSFTDRGSVLSPVALVILMLHTAKRLGRATDALAWAVNRMNGDAHKARAFRGYAPSEHDVFIATFSKSGTNWLMQLVEQIAWRGAAEFDHIHDVVAWPEFPLRTIAPLRDDTRWEASPAKRRGIKTAAPARHVPIVDPALYLSVFRDPKDVLVSGYHFLLGSFQLLDAISFEDWYEKIFVGGPMSRHWADHTASWWNERQRSNVQIFNFRELKGDLGANVDKVASLMRVSLSPEERSAVIERCGFEWMKAHGSRFDPPTFPFLDPDQRPQMLRSGKVGVADELMDDSHKRRVDDVCRDHLARLGSDFPYDEWFNS